MRLQSTDRQTVDAGALLIRPMHALGGVLLRAFAYAATHQTKSLFIAFNKSTQNQRRQSCGRLSRAREARETH